MELSQRVDELEAELKIIKNEVQTVLLDIRERVLSYYDNPFQVIERGFSPMEYRLRCLCVSRSVRFLFRHVLSQLSPLPKGRPKAIPVFFSIGD